MSDLYAPVHRALRFILLVAADDLVTTAWGRRASAEATCSTIERALDALDMFATVEEGALAPLIQKVDPHLQGSLDAERTAIRALRAELRSQLALVRAAEPGAVKRLQGLVQLLVEAELRHMLRKEREIEPRLRATHSHAVIDERAEELLRNPAIVALLARHPVPDELIGPLTFS